MTLKKLIKVLQTYENDLGDTAVHVIIGEFRYTIDINDVNFCFDADNAKHVQLLPDCTSGQGLELFNLIEEKYKGTK